MVLNKNRPGDEANDNDDNDILASASESDSEDTIPVSNVYVGQWVLVNYDGEEYPGEVTAISDQDIQVNVMHKSGGAWKWPKEADKIYYAANDVAKYINPPKAAGSRGQFVFEEL